MRRAAARALGAVLAAGAVSIALLAGPGVWKEPPAKAVLKTGIPLIHHRDGSSAMTVVGLIVGGGRAAVPDGLDGLAYLTTRLTLEIPDEGKARDLMSQATRMTLRCEEDFTAIFIECLTANLEDALRVAGKIIQEPLMSGLRIGRGKELMELYAKAEEDDAVLVGAGAALRAFYGGKGYGSSNYGSAASRKAIERKDVLSFYRRHFTSENVLFCVVSDLDAAPVRALLEKHFAGFPAGLKPDVPAAAPVRPADDAVRLAKETQQTYLARVFVLPPPDPAGHAKGYLAEVLTGTGPGSRLWGLRASGRLAYNVDSRLTWTRDAGLLEAFIETENAKADKAEAALDGVLTELWDKGIAAGELEATKTMAKAQFLRANETKAERALTLGRFERLGLGFDHLSGIFGALDAVTLDDLNAYIRAALNPAKALKIEVGPGSAGPSKGERP